MEVWLEGSTRVTVNKQHVRMLIHAEYKLLTIRFDTRTDKPSCVY